MSPLGRSLAGAAGIGAAAEGGLVRGQDPAVANWRPDGHERRRNSRECSVRGGRRDARPLGERSRRARPEDMEIAPNELVAGIGRIDVRWWHRPDRRLSGAVPADQDPPGRGAIAERVRMDADAAAGLVVAHCASGEEGVQAGRHVFGAAAGLVTVRQTAEREDGSVSGRDDVGAVPRAPHLDEGRIVQCRWRRALNASVDRKQRGARHAVLKPRPRGAPERCLACRHPHVERPDHPPMRQNFGAAKDQSRFVTCAQFLGSHCPSRLRRRARSRSGTRRCRGDARRPAEPADRP